MRAWEFIRAFGGGYDLYIWSAYGVSALALLGAAASTLTAWHAAKARLAQLEKIGASHASSTGPESIGAAGASRMPS